MAEQHEADLSAALEDAVSAFDAANLAWGQFYLHVWRRRSPAEVERAQRVRDALGDAALSVPQDNDAAGLQEFVEALETARAVLEGFVEEGDEQLSGDVRDLPSLLVQAIEALRPYLSS
jgi:hypothetical protein